MRSQRLQMVAGLCVKQPGLLIDVGTDHGQLVEFLVGQGHQWVCGTDPVFDQPNAFTRRASWVLADGLACWQPGAVSQVVIAGLGESTICNIVERDQAVLAACQRLVLCPHGRPHGLRSLLQAQGWQLLAEDIAEEGGRHYRGMAWQPTSRPSNQSLPQSSNITAEGLIGPLLITSRHPLLAAWLTDQRQRWRGAWDYRQQSGNYLQQHLWAVDQIACQQGLWQT